MRTYFGEQIDNSPLIFFRICFGFLAFVECAGAIATGWVERAFIIPYMTFPFIGFEWLDPLPGAGMYYYYGGMALLGFLIMVGLFYRGAAALFFLMWTAAYLMQKTNYNNHYYLMVLISGAMVVMPANKYASLDVKFGFTRQSLTCARAYVLFFIVQVAIVYLYASINKLYPDWLRAEPLSIWFAGKKDYWLIGDLLQEKWFQYFIAYGGILYDGSIVFLLLFRKTRKLGFALSVIFNLFNSYVFRIGIFPYMMIAFSVLFFPPATIRRIFFRRKPAVQPQEQPLPQYLTVLFAGYFALQVLLPARHYFYPGDVHWTEEGHRMAWQMMLYSKGAWSTFRVVDKNTGEEEIVKPRDYLTYKQAGKMSGHPDMIWQFVQFLKKEKYKGKDIAVYVTAKCKINRQKYRLLVDPEVDMAEVEWEPFSHAKWILSCADDDRSEK